MRKPMTLSAAQVMDLMMRGVPLISFGRDLYNIPEIRTAINFIAEKVASVPFYHVRADNVGNISPVFDRANYVLTIRANPYMSPQVFWTHVITRVLLTNNCFIYPEWDAKGNLKALHPMPYTQFDYGQDEDGRIVVVFTQNGVTPLYYDDVIHLQRFPTMMGGTRLQATGSYTQIINSMQNQAVKDAETNGRVAALLKTTSILKDSDMKKKLEDFKNTYMTAENTTGFGMIGSDYEVQKLDIKANQLNTQLLGDITSAVYNYFGVSSEVLKNTASEIQHEQFVDNCIKPWIFQIEEELTYKLFSELEISRFNRIFGETVDLEISTLASKTMFYKEMIYGTVVNRNEVRKRMGMTRGPEELDLFLRNKNFEVLDERDGGGAVEDGTGTKVET